MNIAGIIAEYNPFHKGHEYHIRQTKKEGADFIVAIMSSNFVQRSEPAILPKHIRSKMALKNGVDLVVELPLPWATASANRFAFGGVFIADSMQIISRLSFGSECGDIDLLKKTAKKLGQIDEKGQLKDLMQKGLSFPSARESFFYGLDGEEDILKVLKSPNDILAIEYCRAIEELNSHIIPFAVRRFGAGHDSMAEDEGFLSASAIRKGIHKEYNKNKDIDLSNIYKFLPPSVGPIIEGEIKKGNAPSNYKDLELAVLADLRRHDREYFLRLPDVSEGLENRIIEASNRAKSIDELYSFIKTKRYTLSRIRRIVLTAFLGIDKDILGSPPPYIRVLAFNQRGRELLPELKKRAKLPIVTRYADVKDLSPEAQALFDLEAKATGIYNLSLPKIREANTEYTDEICIL